nr:MAG TPA: hypothetical protein [Caudoviricetes sp.]
MTQNSHCTTFLRSYAKAVSQNGRNVTKRSKCPECSILMC